MRSACRTIVLALALTLGPGACTEDGDDDATEVIIVIDAHDEVRARSSRLRLRIESRGDTPGSSGSERHDVAHWPFTLGLTPKSGDASRQYRVTAEALDEHNEVVAAARIVSGFVAGEQRRVRMVLERACIDRPVCEKPEETCHLPRGSAAGDDPTCTNAYVDPEQLGRGETPELGDLLDAAAVADAGADSDGAVDGAVDGGPTSDAGDGGDARAPLDPCAEDNGGCDPLTACSTESGAVVCSACPTGFDGDGDDGCEPRLLDLTVSPGELTPAFAPDATEYAARIPLALERIAITASTPQGVSLAIAGETATSGQPSTSPVLAVGTAVMPIAIDLVADTGASASYALTVSRGAQRAYVKASNTGMSDHFGSSVAISGDTVVIGAESEDGTGAAYVFVRDDAGIWTQQAHLTAHNAGAEDKFGYAVAISGDTIVVGAPLEDSSTRMIGGDGSLNNAGESGAAYVFVRAEGEWLQEAYLKASNADALDTFGQSVAIARDTIAVGAPLERGNTSGVGGEENTNDTEASGAVYVFARNGNGWLKQVYLKAESNGMGHLFGTSVAVGPDGDAVVVGAPGDRNADAFGRGSAYMFTRGSGVWMRTAHLKAGASTPGEAFGQSVAMSQETVVVGSGDEPGTQPAVAGAVHVFERSEDFAIAHRLEASNRDPRDGFGHSVAVDGDLLLVGAPREAGSVLGVRAEAPRADNAAMESGAAYVFARTAGSWMALAYLKARNADSADRFGNGVAISNGILLVGAIAESSSATGVNAGDDAEADNAANASGAAYVFE